jgi:preprotein translocase subunit SecA
MRQVRELYRQKEIEFPVKVAMARFMSEQSRNPLMGQRYDREGLLRWYQARFGATKDGITEEDFRTQPRSKLYEMLLAMSQKAFPPATQEDIDARLEESFEGASVAEEGDAQELVDWAKANLGLELSSAQLTGLTFDEARNRLWSAFDERYRLEMKRAERGLLLERLDRAWKNHLYVMDHLRQGIGLVGYAQIDPKTEYKRQGMKEFDAMWEGLGDKVSEAVFRLEDDEAFQDSVWSISSAVHEAAPGALAAAQSIQGEQQAAIAGSQQSGKKVDPIRNKGVKIGRNDPCPCGSGKKYKNCCMRTAVK